MSDDARSGARNLLVGCAALGRGERALIVSDTTTRDVGDLVVRVGAELGLLLEHMVVPPLRFHGDEPSAEVASAMAAHDVVLGLTAASMAHSRARRDASLSGTRYLSLPQYSLELLGSPALAVDFRALTGAAEQIARALTDAPLIEVTAAAGTLLTMSSEGRSGNAAPGWTDTPGGLASPPDAEANVAPVEGSARGIVVVDGSIPWEGLGLLREPITLAIEEGLITRVTGGAEARLLEAVLDGLPESCRVLAELGMGLNPAARLGGGMLEDEGCVDTVHFGFGTNIALGGDNAAPAHLDAVIRQTTVRVGGTVVTSDGMPV